MPQKCNIAPICNNAPMCNNAPICHNAPKGPWGALGGPGGPWGALGGPGGALGGGALGALGPWGPMGPWGPIVQSYFRCLWCQPTHTQNRYPALRGTSITGP